MGAGLNVGELLRPIADDRPCGESFEDTQTLGAFDAYQLFGQATLAAPPVDDKDPKPKRDPRPSDRPPDWAEIQDRAADALRRSKDLRLLAHFGIAGLWLEGLEAFFDAIDVASRWLETHWADTYPRIDDDAILRQNALNYFADPVAALDRIRRVPLVASRQHGRFSLRDIEIATGEAQGTPEVAGDKAQIDAAFGSMPLDELRTLQQRAAGALAAVRAIDARMRDEAGPDAAPNFDPLTAQLVKIDRLLRGQLALRPDAVPEEHATLSATAPGEVIAVRTSAPGDIRSRQDAIRALDALQEFFRQTEPSSPVPLILERAKRLVAKNFLEVLADIAPEAVGKARAVGGLKDGE